MTTTTRQHQRYRVTNRRGVSPQRQGFVTFDEAKSKLYAVFTREQAVAALGYMPTTGDRGAAEELTGWYDSYGGPGRTFARVPCLRASARRVLVTQYVGIDC